MAFPWPFIKSLKFQSANGQSQLDFELTITRFRDFMILKNGEWSRPRTKMKKSESANGQIQKLAIRWSGPQ